MDNRNILLSALSVGVGVGVGIGLSSGQGLSKWGVNGNSSSDGVTPENLEQEMLRMVVDGRETNVTFDQFPFYLREQTRVTLTSAAYVHLKNAEVSRHTRNLAPASRTIMLSGPAELYQQVLAKALAHYFEAKLLLLDLTDFSLKIQNRYGYANNRSIFKRSTSETTLERISDLFESFSIFSQKEELKGTTHRQPSGVDLRSTESERLYNPSKIRRNSSASANISNLALQSNPTNSASAPQKNITNWPFDEKLLVQTLYKVLVYVSKTYPIVLYLRDVDKLLYRSQRIYNLFQKMLNKLHGRILILGSRVFDSGSDYKEVDERLSSVFPYNIEISPPEDECYNVSWKSQFEENMKTIQTQDNRNHIMEVLAANDLYCDDLGSICVADTMAFSDHIEEIVVSAISHHLMNNIDPEYRNGKLVIPCSSLSHAWGIFQEGKFSTRDTLKLEAQTVTTEPREEAVVMPETVSEKPAPEIKAEADTSISVGTTDGENAVPASKVEVPPDNEFEKRIRPEVIPANEIGVKFSDVGALDETKESLQELVMLPLRRPDLFRGGLLKPCKGILLFGPPGTGKTMLAKAIANEAGASFINVSMSTVTSKWFGEDEKNVRGLFTLAAKVSPTIIFVDEVDSMLGQRTRVGEHEAMRKIKNEFMTLWDGLMTNPAERILVLAATNRPFDLDEAIIRRFERRIMVGMPSVENREKILRTLLRREKVDKKFDFKELATMTEGYSGSDLKNLCTTAAYRPVRELIQQERLKMLEKRQKGVEEQNNNVQDALEAKEEVKQERVISLRPLNMQDFKEARSQVSASYAAEGAGMSELKQWNEMYGEGGSRKREQLSYFL
ncbi:ribosome biogenesis ATPase RIX7 [Vigna radiata var. radiata]|uniref:Ribosome biogenesis ATPase RIX7 n=1 Tax=Vigna radiata var. radiata TaxID=3916 RepID=A0A3Q0EGU9_VIGRR|nr:ribosome biogenesis ATPase RIX7 [Vigna radiata var. radiata]